MRFIPPQLKEPPKLAGYYYSGRRARAARDASQLLSIRIETSLICNLRCTYCYNRSGKALDSQITFEELIDVINQAKDLKAESVVIIGGGEPTIYPQFKDLVRHIYSLGMIAVIFTNAQTMTKELSTFLFDHKVSVIFKLDSLNEETQNSMAGAKNAHKKIMAGLNNLTKSGYAKNSEGQDLKLGAAFVVNNLNMHEVPDIWRFCRDRGIFPNLEMMIPSGNGEDIQDKLLTPAQWKKLKLELLEIDKHEYGYHWLPYTPLVGCGCFQVMYNLYISVKGTVRPCASICDEDINISDYSLKEIIKLPFFNVARNIDQHLQGKCKSCEHISQCIGCRGLAHTIGKNNGEDSLSALCREDPSCFKKCNSTTPEAV